MKAYEDIECAPAGSAGYRRGEDVHIARGVGRNSNAERAPAPLIRSTREQSMGFKKGQSGIPSGRPKGISDRRTQLRKLLAPHAQELVNKAVELARSGDSRALRLCLERIMASIRAKDEPVSIDQPGTTLTERGQAIVNASLMRQITRNEAAILLLEALATQARVIETDEVEPLLKALEEN